VFDSANPECRRSSECPPRLFMQLTGVVFGHGHGTCMVYICHRASAVKKVGQRLGPYSLIDLEEVKRWREQRIRR
jgi:hypothetical protein